MCDFEAISAQIEVASRKIRRNWLEKRRPTTNEVLGRPAMTGIDAAFAAVVADRVMGVTFQVDKRRMVS